MFKGSRAATSIKCKKIGEKKVQGDVFREEVRGQTYPDSHRETAACAKSRVRLIYNYLTYLILLTFIQIEVHFLFCCSACLLFTRIPLIYVDVFWLNEREKLELCFFFLTDFISQAWGEKTRMSCLCLGFKRFGVL